MKCQDIRESMPDLATGEIAAGSETERHLHSCGECAGKLEEFRRTMALLEEWQAPEPSPYFDTRLRARLREEMAQPAARGWLHWVRKPALATALAVAMVAGITLFRGDGIVRNAPVRTAANMKIQPGTAVGDLEALDNNPDLYSDFEVLDDLQVQQNVNANP